MGFPELLNQNENVIFPYSREFLDTPRVYLHYWLYTWLNLLEAPSDGYYRFHPHRVLFRFFILKTILNCNCLAGWNLAAINTPTMLLYDLSIQYISPKLSGRMFPMSINIAVLKHVIDNLHLDKYNYPHAWFFLLKVKYFVCFNWNDDPCITCSCTRIRAPVIDKRPINKFRYSLNNYIFDSWGCYVC